MSLFIILVTHDYPPSPLAGAVRPALLARGLAQRGHEVLVLTAQASPETEPDGPKVVSIPYTSAGAVAKRAVGIEEKANAASAAARYGRAAETLTRVAARTLERIALYPDKQRAWIHATDTWMSANSDKLRGASAVIASSPPVSAAYVGRRVAAASGARFVIDFRDLWTDNLYYPYGPIRRTMDRLAESRLLKSASALSFATQRLANKTASRTDAPAAVVRTAPSPPASLRPPPAYRPDATFQLGFFGSTYGGRRDLRPVIRALGYLSSPVGRTESCAPNECNMRLNAWGDVDRRAIELVNEDPLLGRLVHFPGSLTKRDADKALLDTHLALCPMWPDDTDGLPVKVLEYLAAGREVLVAGASAESEIREDLAGVPNVHFADDGEAIVGVLLKVCDRWKSGETLFHPLGETPAWMSQDAFVDGFLALIAGAQSAEAMTA